MHLFNYKHQVMHLKTGFSSESKILDGCLCVLIANHLFLLKCCDFDEFKL